MLQELTARAVLQADLGDPGQLCPGVGGLGCTKHRL